MAQKKVNALLQSALDYEQIGWYVLPLRETVKEKRPYVKWKHRRDKRPDTAEIKKWWSQWPNANVGIATGSYSGVDVLDFDGAQVIPQVEQITGEQVDKTYSVTTGRADGGTHIYYKHNKNNKLKNMVGAIPGVSMDIRTDKGILVVPPSVHFKTKSVYKWNGRDPRLNGAEFSQMPLSILQAIQKVRVTKIIEDLHIPAWVPRTYTTNSFGISGSTLDATAVAQGVQKGKRDQLIFQLVSSLRARNVSYSSTVAQAYILADKCTPPFSREVAKAKVDRAWAEYPAGSSPRPSGLEKPIDAAAAASRLDAVKVWVRETKYPQYEWLKKVEDLPESDIEIVINSISKKTGTSKKALKDSLNSSRRRAAETSTSSVFEGLNERYGWLTIGKTAYIVDTSREDKLKVLTSSTFIEQYGNQTIAVPTADGQVRRVPLGTAWLKSKNRRDFEGVYFHPTKPKPGWYNMYHGFAVTPTAQVDLSKIKRYVAHVNNIVCSNEVEMMRYVWAWCADIFQHPEEKKGVALVLMGGRGVGKGFFAQPLRQLWGSHSMHLTNRSQFSGRFNSHLANKIFIFVDEAFWSGDKSGEGVVKGLITEEQIPIEAKGVDVVNVDNFCKFVMASNEEWTVPAGIDERRFCCLDISGAKAKDWRYFEALHKEISDPLFAPNLLRYLLDHKYDCGSVRQAPSSMALTNQKLHSLNPVEEYWYERLQEGESDIVLRDWETKPSFISTTALYTDYIDRSIEKNRYRMQRSVLCRKIFGGKGLCPGAQRYRSEKAYGYILPTLQQCRTAFEVAATSEGKINW